MQTEREPASLVHDGQLDRYPLLEAIRGRRSRRFGLGMSIKTGPLAYQSRHPAVPLDETEEATLAYAACGITGPALADLSYGTGQGGSMLAGLVGRTIASPDAINTVSLVVTNDQVTYLIKRPQDLARDEPAALLSLAEAGSFAEVYRRMRVKIKDGRSTAPLEPGYNFNINKWSLHVPGSTYFVPINELTAIYINSLLEAFNEEMGLFVLDERASFRPAGLAHFARSRGGHLENSPGKGRVGTVQALETALQEAVAVEQGMILQNLGLMTQALGLGGFPNFALHPYGWFQSLGFRMRRMPGSRFLGAHRVLSTTLRVLGRDQAIPFPVGLERDGSILLKAYCPPYFSTMAEAVRSFVDLKFGPRGVFRGGSTTGQSVGGWRDAQKTMAGITAPSEKAIEATIAYCTYILERYGRFPAYSPPFRTVLGYQATHVDVDFYDLYYGPRALTEAQRQHMSLRHPG